MQRPEGALIEQALATARRSRRDLAEAVDLSEGRIRQIVNGYKSEAGMVLPVIAPADTLFRVADELGITEEEMSRAGRDDVADLLHRRPSLGVTEEGDLWLADRDAMKQQLLDWIESGDDRPPHEPLHLWSIRDLLMAVDTKHESEVTLLNHLLSIKSGQKEGGTSDVESDVAQKSDDDNVTHLPNSPAAPARVTKLGTGGQDKPEESSDPDDIVAPAADDVDPDADEEPGGSDRS